MYNFYDYIPENPLFRQFKASELLFTEFKCPEESAVFNIWSELNYFVYVVTGKEKWLTVQGEYVVGAGEAIFVKKGANTIHKFFEENFCAIIIFVPDDFIHGVVHQYSGRVQTETVAATWGDSVFPLHLDERLQACFYSLTAYFRQQDTPPADLLELKFKELIISLITSKRNIPLGQYFISLCHASKSSIREVMEANFPYNLTLEEYARLCSRSLSTFKRDFRRTYQLPPGKWLKKRRLEYSRYLLQTTDKNINEIAFASGFENTSHFIKVFRQVFGITPFRFKQSAF